MWKKTCNFGFLPWPKVDPEKNPYAYFRWRKIKNRLEYQCKESTFLRDQNYFQESNMMEGGIGGQEMGL